MMIRFCRILSLGGLGVISVLSNVAPKETHDMVMKFMEGDTAGAPRFRSSDSADQCSVL